MSMTPDPTEPAITWSADKAWVGAAVSALVAGLTALLAALDDNTVTTQEIVTLVLAMIVGSGLTGAAVYQKGNHPR